MRESDRRGDRQWTAGDVVAYPAGYVHRSIIGPRGCELFHVRIPAEQRLDLLGATDFAQLAPLLIHARRERMVSDSDGELARCGWIMEAVDQLIGARRWSGIGSARLKRIRERLAEDFEKHIRLGDLAEEEHVDPSHLTRAFRTHYGVTPGEFRRAARVARAARVLGATARPIAAIALEFGFTDQAHFTRVFRRCTGVTPARYRRETSV